MMPIYRRTQCLLFTRYLLFAAATVTGAACGEPTASLGPSMFTADVRGTTTERLTGSATVSSGDDWMRQNAFQVRLPDGVTLSGITLSASNGTTISFFCQGADIPSGTFAVGTMANTLGGPTGRFSGGYVVRRKDGLQLFFPDSGSLSITRRESGVSGTFTLYAKHFEVIPLPTPENSESIGKPITPLSSGDSPVRISGSFDAVRR